MKLGFSTVMYEDLDLNTVDIVQKATDLGYQGIELNLKEWPSESNMNAIQTALKENDVEVAAIGTRHMHVTHGLYLASPNEKIRRKALIYIEDCMKIARVVGSPLVQAGWAFQGSKLEASKKTTWKNAIESLEKVGRIGEEYGIIFVIEFACTKDVQLVTTMDEALCMLEDVQSEKILVMADVYHIDAENDSPRDAVLKAGRKLGYVHLSDNNRITPGEGHINFHEFINALRDIGYKGYMVMEFDPKPSPDIALTKALKHLKKIL